MIRFGDLINGRCVVYFQSNPIGIADLVEGKYILYDARTKTNKEVEALSEALKFFKQNTKENLNG